MGERRGTKALELWCRRITDSYPGVSVQNMTTSWRNGLAFCAMIHHFRPELIDFSSLNKDDIYGNNELAFRTAEQHLGIPALLDAEDMASCSVPDRLSILTYLSQFYQVFGGSSSNRLTVNRTSENSAEKINSVPESPQPKVSSRLGMHREWCVSCGQLVFLAEKLMVSHNAFHRSCFRCAYCHQQLSLHNYYETKEGQYCCETCPIVESPEVALLEVLLSDEEKSMQRSYKLEKKDDDCDSNEIMRKINYRIDELTSEHNHLQKRATSPDARQRRDLRVNSAPDIVDFRQASDEKKPEKCKKQIAPALKRSISLRDTDKDTTKNSDMNMEKPRWLSLVQRRLKFFDSEPEPEFNYPLRSKFGSKSEPESESESESKHEFKLQDKYKSRLIQNVEVVKVKEACLIQDDYPKNLNPFISIYNKDQIPTLQSKNKEHSTNPFDSSDEESNLKHMNIPAKPIARSRFRRITEIASKRLIEAPQINLNPFWSDDEAENDQDNESESRSKSPPVAKPRILRQSRMDGCLLPYPKSNLTSSSIHSSNTSIASSCSTITPGGTCRKKKPAPPPPILNQSYETPIKSLNTSTNSNPSLSPKLTPKNRKSKPAPAPPLSRAHEINWVHKANILIDKPVRSRYPNNDSIDQHDQFFYEEKLNKDEANRNTQNLTCIDTSTYLSYPPDKNIEGKWKKKKGPAPPRPIPLRRKIKVISMKDVKLELDQIEMQQQGLEKQGVRLEQIIRNKCESGTANEENSTGLDVEELVLELFALVNEKNELFRRQAELILLKRQQRLEEEHADIEYQVRCLITQPEATKTDFDKQCEETLIQRLIEIVERRNEIIECLEMDRRREIEEDRSIHKEMDLYAARSKIDNINLTDEFRHTSKLKKGKVKDKIKEKKSKKNNSKDADKDVDETEAKLKLRNLRKWF